MKKGFTSKELTFALFILGLAASIAILIISNFKNDSNENKLLNQAKLYINSLNASIIEAKSENKTILYQTYLPMKEGETVTFKIENIRINKTDEYNGIIKVTYEGNNSYKYKIAIHDNNFMIGTEDKLIEENKLEKHIIKDFNSKLFYK